MKEILETDYDVKHYKNCLAHNLQLIDDLTNATRVTIQKEEWEAPMLTVYRGDKHLGSWVIDRYPKTRQGIQSIAHKRIAQQINEIKAINEHINEELNLYKADCQKEATQTRGDTLPFTSDSQAARISVQAIKW